MKILIVSNMYPGHNPDMDYAGIFVKEQKDALEKVAGVKCDVFVIDGFKSKINYVTSSFKVLSLIKNNHYDVIHVHYGLSGIFTLLTPFKKKWRNVVLTLHGGDILSVQGKIAQVFLTKLVISRVGYVITLNEEMNSVVSKIRSEYQVLPCGVDASFFQPQPLPGKKNVVLFPGKKERLVKNFDYFQKVINSYNVNFGKIEFIALDGFDRDQVKDLMSTSKALLMTSISEGSPQSIKEALSTDIAIVSSDVGDVRKIFGDTPGTKIFKLSDDPAHVAELLQQAISEADQTPNARRSRILGIGLDNYYIAKKLIEIYNQRIDANALR